MTPNDHPGSTCGLLALAALLLAVTANAQLTWTADATRPRPLPGDTYRMVASANGLILFGGVPNPVTWRFRNGNWTLLQTANQPGPRRDFAMAYDASRDQVVLFGGRLAFQTSLANDTWTFDGADWTEQSPARRPPGRERTAMAFDPRAGRMVLFGGSDRNLQVMGDTWSWNGADWQEMNLAISPAPRARHAMAFGPDGGQVLLFGGSDAFGVLDDTWLFEGSRWRRHVSDLRPPSRWRHSLTTHTDRGRVVLHGGSVTDQDLLSDTWEFGLGGWIETTPAVPGPAVHDHASAFDADTGEVLLFGGAEPGQPPADPRFPVPSDQFHRYAATVDSGFDQMTTSFCGAIARIQTQGRPLVGNSGFRFFTTASPAFFDKPFVALLAPGFAAQPLRLGPCDLHLTGTIDPLPSLSRFQGSFHLPIPNDRALAGAQLYVQATGPADGPFSGFQGFGLSPTYRITVGD